MMKTDYCKFLLAVLLVAALSGCATTKSTGSVDAVGDEDEDYASTTLPVTWDLRFSDVPAPVGFKLIHDRSLVFQTENTRVALLKYAGRAKLPDLVDFYKEQMALYNWELLNIVEYEKSVLNFARSRQTCIVTIEGKGMKKIITISVAPKASGSIETQAQK